jgi:cyclopropane fatty-acyl-phospholipid synthase-like methyltransferase
MKDFWEERYRADEFIYGKQPNEYLRIYLDYANPGRLLLPGDGEGRNAVHAAKKGWTVDAFDISENARLKALNLAKEEGVTINYFLQSYEDYQPEPATYDVIALIFTHMPSSIRRPFHEKMVTALKKGGTILLEAFSENQVLYTSGGPRDLDMLYNKEDIRQDFKGLSIQALEQLEIELDEGTYHQGVGEVIRMMGKKM